MRSICLAGLLVGLLLDANADVLFEDGFSARTEGWQDLVNEDSEIAFLPEGGRSGGCLFVKTVGEGTAFFQRSLDAEDARGSTVTFECWAKLENVGVGTREFFTAKIRIVVTCADGRLRHFATRFSGTSDWTRYQVTAPIPTDAQEVVVDLGIQKASGVACFDDLVISDDRKPNQPLNLALAATTSRSDGVAGDGRGGFLDLGPTDLRELEGGQALTAGSVPFRVPAGVDGRECVVLQGRDLADRPQKGPAPVPVGMKVSALSFLQAAYTRDPAEPGEVAFVCTVTYSDKVEADVPMRLGHELVSLLSPADAEEAAVGWRRQAASGREVGLGVFTWANPRPDVAVQTLRFHTNGKGPCGIVVAVTGHRSKARAK